MNVLLSRRHLLWHGSRLTNWVGILSQGLRIAPPEAPVTGYMVRTRPSVEATSVIYSTHPVTLQFGKGVYFADMCSKSANYCFASRANNEGLLILCDVSLCSVLSTPLFIVPLALVAHCYRLHWGRRMTSLLQTTRLTSC